MIYWNTVNWECSITVVTGDRQNCIMKSFIVCLGYNGDRTKEDEMNGPNVGSEVLALPLCIQEAPGSNLCP
jgi:hypothetical protein